MNSQDHQFLRGAVEDTVLSSVIIALGSCASL